MISSENLGRIADAVVAIRPEWNVGQVFDYLEAQHTGRQYDALAAAAVYVAAQRLSVDLSWLEMDGPWWIQVPEQPARDPEGQKITRVRDEAWWDRYNLAVAQRRITHGTPAQKLEQQQQDGGQ